MKTFKSICIGCGKEVEFEYCKLGDITNTDYEITDESEVGWWDFECSECGWCVDYDRRDSSGKRSKEGLLFEPLSRSFSGKGDSRRRYSLGE